MISLYINELPPLTTFSETDRILVDQVYTVAANMSTVRAWMFDSAVVPSITATNLIVSNLSALSSTFVNIDVKNYELSGFTVKGTLYIDENGTDKYSIVANTTNAIVVPAGTTGERPNPGTPGALRFNTTDNAFEGFNATEWGALGETTQDVFVDEPAGNIQAGTTVYKGTSLQDLVNGLFIKTFFPTVGTPAGISISSHVVGGQTNVFTVEAGTAGITLNVSYTSGSIDGKTNGTWSPPVPPGTVTGVWLPGSSQGPSGPNGPTSYTIMGTDYNTSNTTATDTKSTTIVDGSNVFSASVTYGQGPMPYDSKGGSYDSIRDNGNTKSTSRTIIGARRIWYGINIGAVNETNIRNIANSVFSSTAGSSHSFNIVIPAGTNNVIIAAPTDVGTPEIISAGGGIRTDVTNAFITSTPTVRGANDFEGSRDNYTAYLYTPVVPFTDDTVYEVTF